MISRGTQHFYHGIVQGRGPGRNFGGGGACGLIHDGNGGVPCHLRQQKIVCSMEVQTAKDGERREASKGLDNFGNILSKSILLMLFDSLLYSIVAGSLPRKCRIRRVIDTQLLLYLLLSLPTSKEERLFTDSIVENGQRYFENSECPRVVDGGDHHHDR